VRIADMRSSERRRSCKEQRRACIDWRRACKHSGLRICVVAQIKQCFIFKCKSFFQQQTMPSSQNESRAKEQAYLRQVPAIPPCCGPSYSIHTIQHSQKQVQNKQTKGLSCCCHHAGCLLALQQGIHCCSCYPIMVRGDSIESELHTCH